jgi:hypothetical protein
MARQITHYGDAINLPSIERNWPIGRRVPDLIGDIATLLINEPSESVGIFAMKGTRFDDYWVEDGGDLSEQFGFFVTLPDGSKVGQWFHKGVVEGSEPVVGVSSEGDLVVLAPNLKAFMRDWAKGTAWLELGLAHYDDSREVKAKWKAVAAKMMACIETAPDHLLSEPIGNLEGFMEAYSKAAIQKAATHPFHQEIVRLMARHIPTGDDKLACYNLQIKIAGPRIELLPDATPEYYPKRAPIPAEAPQILPLILKLRDERASGAHLGRGLWNSASLKLYQGDIFGLANPLALLLADWECEAGFETGGRMTKAELTADLTRFPRDPRWMMPWMDELV